MIDIAIMENAFLVNASKQTSVYKHVAGEKIRYPRKLTSNDTIKRSFLEPLAKTGQNEFTLPITGLPREINNLISKHLFFSLVEDAEMLDNHESAAVYAFLSKHLPPGSEALAFTHLRTLAREFEEVRFGEILVALAKEFPQDNPSSMKVFTDLCADLSSFGNSNIKPCIIANLSTHLPKESTIKSYRHLCETVFNHEGFFTDDYTGVYLSEFEALAKHLPPEMPFDAHSLLCSHLHDFEYDDFKIAAFTVLAQHLPPGSETKAHITLFNCMNAFESPDHKIAAFTVLAQHLPPGSETKAFQALFDCMNNAFENPHHQSAAFKALSFPLRFFSDSAHIMMSKTLGTTFADADKMLVLADNLPIQAKSKAYQYLYEMVSKLQDNNLRAQTFLRISLRDPLSDHLNGFKKRD